MEAINMKAKGCRMKTKEGMIYLTLSKPIGKLDVLKLIGIAIFIFVPYIFLEKQELNPGVLIFGGIFFLFLLSGTIAAKKIIICPQKRLVEVSDFFIFEYNISKKVWPPSGSLQYEIQYDSYDRITKVCLICKGSFDGKEIYVRLAEFFNLETFKVFQQFFNQNFPECKINEWSE